MIVMLTIFWKEVCSDLKTGAAKCGAGFVFLI